MRNPNGYGTVAKLSGNRRRPFIVKKVSGWKDNGQPIYSVIGYAETREAGNIMLAEYNRDPWNVSQAKITLHELFNLWKEKKAVKLGRASKESLYAAFGHCSKLADRPYKSIKAFQMQETIDTCGRGASTQASIRNLWKHLDRFAMELDIITRCYSDLLTAAPSPETTRSRFSDEEIAKLWEHLDTPWVDVALILIYSGWRSGEFLALTPECVDLQAGTITGGFKTKAGKNRIVPIHSKIRPLVEARLAEGGSRLITHQGKPVSKATLRKLWGEMMQQMGMSHVPHECRHTFESLLDSAGANRKCIDMMMGHASKDVGNRVYNHKTINDLRVNIELITR